MRFSKRVRFGEVDGQGVLYHGRYLDYFDIGIQEYWRAASGGMSPAVAAKGKFHVVRAEIDYVKSITYDELIDIVVRIERFGRSSLTFAVALYGAGDDDVRARGAVIHVQVDEAQGRSMPIDDRNVALLQAFERGRQADDGPMHAPTWRSAEP